MTDLFAEKSEQWDAQPVPMRISSAVGRLLLKRLSLEPTMRVMDFGAGTGLVASHVAPRVERVLAVDVSSSMLEALAAKPELQGKVEPRCQDIIEEPLDEQFDAIVSAMALHHVRDTDAAIRRFFEHLLPGGVLALADLDAEDGGFHPPDAEGVHHHGFDRRALQEVLEQRGFTDVRFDTAVEIERAGGGHYPVFLLTARRP